MVHVKMWLFWIIFVFAGLAAAILIVSAPEPYFDPNFPIGFTEGPFADTCNYRSARIYLFSGLLTGGAILLSMGLAWYWRRRWVSIAALLVGLVVGPFVVDHLMCWLVGQ